MGHGCFDRVSQDDDLHNVLDWFSPLQLSSWKTRHESVECSTPVLLTVISFALFALVSILLTTFSLHRFCSVSPGQVLREPLLCTSPGCNDPWKKMFTSCEADRKHYIQQSER